MKSSKFIKVDNNILVEYQYDSNNNVSEDYIILSNKKTNENQFISTITDYKNTIDKQLFVTDILANKYLKVNTTNYSYLTTTDYAGSTFVRYDIIKIYLPNTYVFDEYKGFKLKIYTKDYTNEKDVLLSTYFYDITDSNRTFEMDFENPPLLFNEKLWGKSISIQIPSVAFIALQRDGNLAKDNSINKNLYADGLSVTSPIFFDFSFISKIETINGTVNYTLAGETTISFPQSAEYESIAINIKPSTNGDYYEIYGIYNGSQSDFIQFINDSVYLGSRYIVEYAVTIFEENIKGKTYTFLVTENFDDVIEFRPIIKFSTTTAIINVEMRLIDTVNDSQILKRASYGMLPNEVSKYSLNLMKINISDATKPKIYNTKADNLTDNKIKSVIQVGNLTVETIPVPYPLYYDKTYAVAKSDSVEVDGNSWKSNGQLRLVIMPFDNIIKLVLAQSIDNTNILKPTIKYFDLSLNDNLNMVFKNNAIEVKCPLQKQSSEIDLTKGMLVFKISQKDISNINSIYNSKINTFYITTTSSVGDTTVLYAGLFTMFDNINNIISLNETKNTEVKSYILTGDANLEIFIDDISNFKKNMQ